MTTHEICLDRAQLRRLATLDLPGPCVSLYLAPIRGTTGRAAAEDSLRVMLRTAHDRLLQPPWSLDEREAARLLQPAADATNTIRARDDESLAVFVAPDFVEGFAVRGTVPSALTVARRPDLLPATLAMDADLEFHLLVLSQRRVELLRCSAAGAVPVPDTDLPTDIDDGPWSERQQPSPGLHGGNRPGLGQLGLGHVGATAKDLHKEAIDRFVSEVDRALPADVHDGPLPLVVAAVEYEAAMLRDARPHRDLVLLTGLGSPERLSVERLRSAAVQALRDRAAVETPDALVRYHALVGTGRTCDGWVDTATAAREGRIASLLVDRVAVEALGPEWDEDLTETVAFALTTGAEIVPVASGTLGDESAVAVLRY